jgi:hypothetical protein
VRTRWPSRIKFARTISHPDKTQFAGRTRPRVSKFKNIDQHDARGNSLVSARARTSESLNHSVTRRQCEKSLEGDLCKFAKCFPQSGRRCLELRGPAQSGIFVIVFKLFRHLHERVAPWKFNVETLRTKTAPIEAAVRNDGSTFPLRHIDSAIILIVR